MDQSLLFPLHTGLFGVPGIIGSLRARPIPPQLDAPGVQGELRPGLRGALSGALVGWFPGISSTTGVIVASALSKDDAGGMNGSHRFLTMVSAVGTSSTVLGLLALSIAFKGRSGAMLAAKEVLGPDGASLLSFPSPWFPLLLMSVLVTSAVSFFLVLRLGRGMARLAAGADLRRLNQAILVLVVTLVTLFCGLPGLIVLAAATFLGTLPPKLGVSRVHLTGCLLLPTALYFLGLKTPLLAVF
jgi:putative membrane protein